MNGKSLLALNLGWLALVVGAFVAGTAVRKEEPAPDEAAKAAGPERITTLAGSPRPTELTGAVPKRMTSGVGVSASLEADDPNGRGRRVANTLQAIDEVKAWQQEQLEQYGEDLKALVDKITVEDAPAMAEALVEGYSGIGHNPTVKDPWLEFFRQWGELAGPDALAFLRSRNTSEAYAAAAEGWTKTDPAAAKAYAINAADAGIGELVRNRLHFGIVSGLIETDLDEAIAHSATHEAGSGKRTYSIIRLSEKIFEQRGADGIESWLAAVEEIHGAGEARDYKAEVVEYGLSRMFRGDSFEENKQRAREWLMANVRKGLVDAETMSMATHRLSASPEDRLAWLMMPDSADPEQQSEYAQLVGEAFGDYLRSDFDAAGEWLAAQPRDQRNDGAIQRYALEAVRYDREAALIWVEEISDERLRAATLARPEFRERTTIVRP